MCGVCVSSTNRYPDLYVADERTECDVALPEPEVGTGTPVNEADITCAACTPAKKKTIPTNQPPPPAPTPQPSPSPPPLLSEGTVSISTYLFFCPPFFSLSFSSFVPSVFREALLGI